MSVAPSILIVEDEYFLAADLARYLRTTGLEVLGPVPSVTRALDLLDRQRPDAAILDIQLDNELSYPVADRLAAMDVPFLFRTEHMEETLPGHLRGQPMISKLAGLPVVGNELGKLLRR